MFHLIHPTAHDDFESAADELASVAALVAFALSNGNLSEDRIARDGAMLVASALSSGVADLKAVGRDEMTRESAKSYAMGLLEGEAKFLLSQAVNVRSDGSIVLAGVRYWGEALLNHAGGKLTARFDPEATQSAAYVYDPGGTYLGRASRVPGSGKPLDLTEPKSPARKKRAA